MSGFRVVHKKTGKVACRTNSPKGAEHEARMLNRLYRTDNFAVAIDLNVSDLQQKLEDFEKAMEEATK